MTTSCKKLCKTVFISIPSWLANRIILLLEALQQILELDTDNDNDIESDADLIHLNEDEVFLMDENPEENDEEYPEQCEPPVQMVGIGWHRQPTEHGRQPDRNIVTTTESRFTADVRLNTFIEAFFWEDNIDDMVRFTNLEARHCFHTWTAKEAQFCSCYRSIDNLIKLMVNQKLLHITIQQNLEWIQWITSSHWHLQFEKVDGGHTHFSSIWWTLDTLLINYHILYQRTTGLYQSDWFSWCNFRFSL